MVVLRLKRMGRTHAPFYRICAMDRRCPPDGRSLEDIGWYNPQAKEGQQYSAKADRAAYWLSVGAQPSQTVRNLFRKMDIDPTPGRKLEA